MSDKITINEEMNLQEEWYKDAKDQTIETLPSFIRHVLDDYCHDYGTICHAIAACGIAAMWAANKHPSAGITGFQAGAVMWEVIRHWMYTNNTCGLRIVDYDDMLFPQYRSKYDKTIRRSTFEALQKEAKSRLDNDNGFADPRVIEHWESIADGVPPFGYTVVED